MVTRVPVLNLDGEQLDRRRHAAERVAPDAAEPRAVMGVTRRGERLRQEQAVARGLAQGLDAGDLVDGGPDDEKSRRSSAPMFP